MRYLNDVEDKMSGCEDPAKILMGAKSGRKAYAGGGMVEAAMNMMGRNGRGIRLDRGIRRDLNRNPNVIKEAVLTTAPKSPMAVDAQSRGDMATGPAYKKGGRTHKAKGGLTCANPGSAPNAQKGMAKKMGLAAGGVGKIRHDQY